MRASRRDRFRRPCSSISVTLTSTSIAHGDHVLHLFHPFDVQAADVDKPFLAGGDFHKRAEGHQAGDLALIDGAHFRILGDGFHHAEGPLGVLGS